jgi:hypothetical protein
MKGQVFVQGEIIKKWGEVIEIFSPQESLSQKSSYLHESFLI